MQQELQNNINKSSTVLMINEQAIIKNFNLIQRQYNNIEIIPVVKNNAYGLGIDFIIPILLKCGANKFFVATYYEGIKLSELLKNLGVKNYNIYILHSFLPSQLQDFINYGLIPVLNSIEEVEMFNQKALELNTRLKCSIQVETGINRLGLSKDCIEKIHDKPNDYTKNLDIDFVMSHFACADIKDHPSVVKQIESFLYFINMLPTAKYSLSASYGAFLPISKHEQIIRPGIALYGGNPIPHGKNPMERVIYLYASILQVKKITKGDSVGYGFQWTAEKNTDIAVISVGYADGFLRNIDINNTYVYINNIKCNVIGRVSMDCITVDVTHLPVALKNVGQAVEIIGDNISLDEFAMQCNTIHCEILNIITERYPRVVV